MSEAGQDVNEASSLAAFPSLRGWLRAVNERLNTYRPWFRDRRFWVIVILVALISTAHTVLETVLHLPFFGLLYFVPSALFLVPAVYAAVTFGLRGAIITALTATVITIPNWFLYHESWETLGCMSQLLVVNITAYFVGRQVSRTKGSQRRTEAVSAALRASETKYRGLFESSPMAILVLDASGTILEANPAAGTLFNQKMELLKGAAIADLVGTAGAQKLLGFSRNDRGANSLTLRQKNGSELHLEPMLTEASDSRGNPTIQVRFRDVTEERHRQAGLRAYAAHVLRIQEEERQHIARELHDGIVQQLILLYRQLSGLADLGDSLPAPLVDRLREAGETTEVVVQELRDFTKALRPPILDDLGLVASVRRLLSDVLQRTALKGEMKVIGQQRRLLADTELGMFRIAQEALRNVERHAQATQLAVTMTFAEHEVSLDVQDNGLGFAVTPVAGDFTASGKLGLISMQERAKLLGGNLEIESSPGNGTRVTASIPA